MCKCYLKSESKSVYLYFTPRILENLKPAAISRSNIGNCLHDASFLLMKLKCRARTNTCIHTYKRALCPFYANGFGNVRNYHKYFAMNHNVFKKICYVKYTLRSFQLAYKTVLNYNKSHFYQFYALSYHACKLYCVLSQCIHYA